MLTVLPSGTFSVAVPGENMMQEGLLGIGFFSKRKQRRRIIGLLHKGKGIPKRCQTFSGGIESSNFLEWIQLWELSPMYISHVQSITAPVPIDMNRMPESQGRFCFLIWTMKKLWLFRNVLKADYYTVFVDDIKPLKNQYNGKEDDFSLLICLFETNQENTYRTCFS